MTRLATDADLPEIMRLLVQFHELNGLAPLDPARVAEAVDDCMAEAMLWVEDAPEGSGLAGLIGIAETGLWYAASSVRTLTDLFFYVQAEHGSAGVGFRLASAARVEAERRNLPLFLISFNPERAGKRGRRGSIWGFIPVGWLTVLRQG